MAKRQPTLEELGRERWSDNRWQATAMEGHPQSRWSPEVAERIIELVEQGLTMVQVAAAVGVGRDAIVSWQELNREFHSQVKAARERAGRGYFHRVSKYTKETHDVIVAALAIGATVDAAAALAGIHHSTLQDWLDPEAVTYVEELATAVNEARARELIENLRLIREAAQVKRTWQAAAWLNERLYPQAFALGHARQAQGSSADNPLHTTNAFVEEAAKLIKQQRLELADRRLKELGVDVDGEEPAWQPPQLPAE